MRTTPKAGMGYQLVLPKKVTTHISAGATSNSMPGTTKVQQLPNFIK
jgi:hypothetical protein